ncbi:MAG TPA: glycosyltransferase family 2 protein [Anaerolineae bacterium]|nr:glycosyltransferase family 2 protein [Anaerolineae bacterium]
MSGLQLVAVVLAHNEERHIGECLDSLAWTDDRLVLDDFSTDRTVEIARERGARLVQHALENFAAQRNRGLSMAGAEWVLFVDTDERVTPELAAEVRRVIAYEDDRARNGWWIPRHNYMIGHRMRGGGWYPEHQLRLLRTARARYDPARPVHEVVVLEGEAGTLENPLIHYNYDTVAQFRTKMGRYTRYEAQILHEQAVRTRPWTMVSMPLREFWRRFVTLRGYRDHVYGLLFCGLMGWYTFVTYRRLRDLRAQASPPLPPLLGG